MFENSQKRCEFCDELFTFERSTARFCSTNCRVQSHASIIKIRCDQIERARKILDRVRNLSEEDFITLRKEAAQKTAVNSINIPEPIADSVPEMNEQVITPTESPTKFVSNLKPRKRKFPSNTKNTKPGLLYIAIEALSNGYQAKNRD